MDLEFEEKDVNKFLEENYKGIYQNISFAENVI